MNNTVNADKNSGGEGELSPSPAPGWSLIADERERQKTEEGWTSDHDDDEHRNGELARAANCYRTIGNGSLGFSRANADQSDAAVPRDWPWGSQWWKPKTRLRNLVRAGALYQAEIDRLCRERMHVTEEIDDLLTRKSSAPERDAEADQAKPKRESN